LPGVPGVPGVSSLPGESRLLPRVPLGCQAGGRGIVICRAAQVLGL